jgi:hypothetical protein
MRCEKRTHASSIECCCSLRLLKRVPMDWSGTAKLDQTTMWEKPFKWRHRKHVQRGFLVCDAVIVVRQHLYGSDLALGVLCLEGKITGGGKENGYLFQPASDVAAVHTWKGDVFEDIPRHALPTCTR